MKTKPYLIIKEQPGLKILVSPGTVKHFYESREIQTDNPKTEPKYSESVKAVFITAILGLLITVLPLSFLYLLYSL